MNLTRNSLLSLGIIFSILSPLTYPAWATLAGSKVGELSWIPVLHPSSSEKRSTWTPSLSGLSHYSPLVDGRLLCSEEFPNVRLPVESGADLDSKKLMDRTFECSVSNVSTLAAYCQL